MNAFIMSKFFYGINIVFFKRMFQFFYISTVKFNNYIVLWFGFGFVARTQQ